MHFKAYIFTAATTHKLPLQLQAFYLRVCVCVKNGKQFAIFLCCDFFKRPLYPLFCNVFLTGCTRHILHVFFVN